MSPSKVGDRHDKKIEVLGIKKKKEERKRRRKMKKREEGKEG